MQSRKERTLTTLESLPRIIIRGGNWASPANKQMSPVTRITTVTLVLLSLIFLSKGSKIVKKVSDTWDDPGRLSSDDEEDNSKPHLPALLDGLQVQGGEINPEFNSNTFNYTVRLSGDVADIQIIAQVSLGPYHEKYKVKTTTSDIFEQDVLNSRSLLKDNETVTLVQVHVSASNHQSVTYYLKIGQVAQKRSNVWRYLFGLLYWGGIVIATVVVAAFLYSIYLVVSSGGLGGVELEGDPSNVDGKDGDYEAPPERTASRRYSV